MKIVFATSNPHKINEVQLLLPASITIIGLSEVGCFEELPETSSTIEGNSLQKAKYVAEKYGCDCFAEDSGLLIDALRGEPGVDTAHYSGTRDHDKNMDLVLHHLKSEDNRAAHFKTVFTLIIGKSVNQFSGIVTGKITQNKIGSGGFGYDPIFMPDGATTTFGGMLPLEKTQFSHRAKAFKLMTDYIAANFEIQ